MSGLEEGIAEDLEAQGASFSYEKQRFPYSQVHYYRPDFILENGILIEAKGVFESDDRTKHLLFKEQYPDKDVRFVFSNASRRIAPSSRTTYGDWCKKNGFKYAEKRVPREWIEE